MPKAPSSQHRLSRLFPLVLVSLACPAQNGTDPGSVTVAVDPGSATVPQGGSTVVTATATSAGGFSGAVTFTVTGAPAGVTATVSNATTSGATTTATVTIEAAASTAPGSYTVTVRAQAEGLAEGTATFALTVTALPDYTLSLSSAALSIPQGASGTCTVTISRTNFADAVTLSLAGAPAGVTGAFAPAAPTGGTSTLTVTVAGSVTPGTYNLTVNGAGTPGNRSAALTLTVTTAPDYSLSLSSTALSVAQGASGTSEVTIARTNFSGAVTLSLGGAPAGVTGAFAPAAPTGTSSTLTVSVAGSVTPGSYDLTVDGAGAPGNRSTPLSLAVTGGGGGAGVTVSFAGCDDLERAGWLAYQDGSGPWTTVTGTADVYTFTVASATGAVAFVTGIGEEPGVQVRYMTQAELTAGTVRFCELPVTRRLFTGNQTGLTSSEYAYVSLGGGSATPLLGSVPIQISGVKDGTHDLVGFRTNPYAPGTAERGLLRRDVAVNGNGTVGTVDFAGSESFAPATATITIGGLAGGETLVHNTFYQVGATCEDAILLAGVITGTSFTAYGIPGSQQRATDYHRMLIRAHSDATGSPAETRTVTESFMTMAARTVTVGAGMPNPTVSSLGGPYLRLQAVYTLPADYQMETAFSYDIVSLSASYAYLGGTSVTLAMPDFSGLAGWDNSWVTGASTANWSVSAVGGTGGAVCAENARVVTARRRGTY
jgi:hypothetical protein